MKISEREWDADEEQYYLENPDEWPLEPDPDLDEASPENDERQELNPEDFITDEWTGRHMNEEGPTADGFNYLSNLDNRGDFV